MRALRKAWVSQLLASMSVMRSTAPPSRKAGHVGSLSGHAARITAQRTLSWSSVAAKPPRDTSESPPSLQRSTATKGRSLIPLVVPEQAQLSHPYNSTTRGRVSPQRGSGTMSQSRFQGRTASAPRAGSPCSSCARSPGAAPRPPAAGAAAIRAGSALGAGGGGWCWGRGSWGGDEVSGVGVDVVEVGVVVVVVVVGVVRRHLSDAGGDAPHQLHVRLRGRPAHRPPPFTPPSPCGSRAPSCLSPGANSALALSLGPLPGPHAFVPLSALWVPPTVTCTLACTAGARILPVPVSMPLAAPTLASRAPLHSMRSVAARLGALLAPLRVLSVPLPFPRFWYRVAPSAARALCPPLPLASVRCPRVRPPSLQRAPRPAPCVCPCTLPLSPRLLSPAPRPPGRYPAPPACSPPPPGSRAGRPVAAPAAAA